MTPTRTALALVVLAGCGGSDDASDGADPRTVRVPSRDASPPTATILVSDAEGERLGTASQPPGDEPHEDLSLDEPRLLAATTGRDDNGGIARVRVSTKLRITCGATTRPRVRYYPPPQTERIRSNPGARLPTTRSRAHVIELEPRCETEGELWGEAINGSGLEAVTAHLKVYYDP